MRYLDRYCEYGPLIETVAGFTASLQDMTAEFEQDGSTQGG